MLGCDCSFKGQKSSLACESFNYFRHCKIASHTLLRAYEVSVVTWQSNIFRDKRLEKIFNSISYKFSNNSNYSNNFNNIKPFHQTFHSATFGGFSFAKIFN